MSTFEDHSHDIELLTSVKPYVIGLCVMEHSALFGIVDARGDVLCSESVPMSDYPEPTAFVFDICDRLLPMIEKCGGLERIKAMGISACSGNNRNGCIENPSNLKWGGKIPLAKMFQGSLAIPVSLLNDATAAAMGEMTFGAAHGLQNFVAVSVNVGLGAGIFVNNRAVLGYNGRVGEIGHVTIFPGGRACGCGKEGCLESYVSRRGIIDNLFELFKTYPELTSTLRQVKKEDMTIDMIAEAAEAGDEVANKVLNYSGELLGKALVPVASFINPEAFVLCGEVGTKCGRFMQRAILEALNVNLFSQMKWQTRVLLSSLDLSEAPLLYASAEAWNTKAV
ncbi:MAG: ROK family protein [Bacteroidales bacterium]|nr:ROK family protein [Bacteroidales bacterium]